MKTLPKNWYIEVTEQNLSILDEWRLSVATSYRSSSLSCGSFVLSKHYIDGSYFYISGEYDLQKDHPGYVKIDFETFLEITQMGKYKVTREQFKQGYKLACAAWKKKLMDEVGIQFALNDLAIVSKELVEEMRKAASNTDQRDLIKLVFNDPNYINSRDLSIGEAMRITDGDSHDGVILLRTYSCFVDINNPNSTWDGAPNFGGIKVKLEINVID